MLRVTGWSKLIAPHLQGKTVIGEQALLEFLVENGRAINANWRSTLAHSMRALGWRLRRLSRTYVPKATTTATTATATTNTAATMTAGGGQ